MLPSQTIKWLSGLTMLKPIRTSRVVDPKPAAPLPPIELPSQSQVQLLQMVEHHLAPRPDSFGVELIVATMDEYEAVDLLVRYADSVELVRDGRGDRIRGSAYLTGTYEVVRSMLELLGDRIQWTIRTGAETWVDQNRSENRIRAQIDFETADYDIVREVCAKFDEKRKEEDQAAAAKRSHVERVNIRRDELKAEKERLEAAAVEALRIEQERQDKYAEEALF